MLGSSRSSTAVQHSSLEGIPAGRALRLQSHLAPLALQSGHLGVGGLRLTTQRPHTHHALLPAIAVYRHRQAQQHQEQQPWRAPPIPTSTMRSPVIGSTTAAAALWAARMEGSHTAPYQSSSHSHRSSCCRCSSYPHRRALCKYSSSSSSSSSTSSLHRHRCSHCHGSQVVQLAHSSRVAAASTGGWLAASLLLPYQAARWWWRMV